MTLHVYTNDTDTVIAADLDDVRAIVETTYGYTLEAEGWSLDDWRRLPDDEVKTIRFDDEVPPGVEPRITKMCAEWVASEGRGFLCSTEF